jgi:WD40 repeat protein
VNADLTSSIVRILDPASKTCGTGFVVHAGDQSLIVTCAHVVDLAKSGPGHSIALTFSPFDLDRSAKKYFAMVEQACWRDAGAEDVAVLRLKKPLPSGVEPLRLGSSLGSGDHVFQSYGFGAAKPIDGLWGQCTVRGLIIENGFPVLQMDSGEVSHGFSGAPVWDKDLQVVVGMVTSIAMPDRAGRQTRATFVIPAETLSRVCPHLRLTDECPYRGLSTFTEQDSAVFFGREQAIRELLKKLRANPQFLAVFGPSGSGKSSLVRAGLIPRLHEENRPQGKDWGVIVTRPADNPSKQLSDQGLDVGPGGLLGGVRRWLTQHPDKQRLLLVIDQFEELFVTCPEAQRSRFFKQVTQLRNEPRATVIIVMRNDFYSQFVEHEALREWLAMSGGAIDIPQTLTRNDLLEIILKPAERYRLSFQEALPELIIRDVMEESAHVGDEDEETAHCTILPLLEFTLTQLWEQRQQGVLTSEAYQAIGGVAGGLTRWAKDVLARLGEEHLPLVERVFLALVHLGDEMSRQPDSRQPASLASLTALGRNDLERAALQHVIQELVNARLLVIHGDLHRHENTVEIIHDALLQHWPALQYWIKRDRDFLQWHQELEQRAQAWIQTNQEDASLRDEGRLLRGRDLTAAEGMLHTRGDELAASQCEYILASQKHMIDKLEKERQRTTALSAALETAQRQKQLALARGLAAQAVLYSQYDNDPNLIERSVLLAIESLRRFPSAEADQALREGGALLRRRLWVLEHEDEVHAIVFSPNGWLVATASMDHTAGVWEVSSGKRVATLRHEGEVGAVAFSPDGRLVATASHDKTAGVWEVGSGRQVATLRHENDFDMVAFSPDGRLVATANDWRTAGVWEVSSGKWVATLEHKEVRAVAFSPDGRLVATASNDHTAKLWEVGSGKQVATLRHEGVVWEVVFSPDGRLVATASHDETARLWEVSSGRQVATLRHENLVNAVAFSPDGRLVATASYDYTARLWEVGRGKRVATLEHEKAVGAVAFSPDGRLVATAGDYYTARLWEVSSGRQVATLRHEGMVNAVAFSPDGRLVATASYDKTARLWEVSSGKRVAILGHEDVVRAVAFSPDGRLVATASDDHTARLWEVGSSQQLVLLFYEDGVSNVAFSPDGKYLATASGHMGEIWLWRPEDLIAAAKPKLTRNLTPLEWKQFLGDEPYCKTFEDLP